MKRDGKGDRPERHASKQCSYVARYALAQHVQQVVHGAHPANPEPSQHDVLPPGKLLSDNRHSD